MLGLKIIAYNLLPLSSILRAWLSGQSTLVVSGLLKRCLPIVNRASIDIFVLPLVFIIVESMPLVEFRSNSLINAGNVGEYKFRFCGIISKFLQYLLSS